MRRDGKGAERDWRWCGSRRWRWRWSWRWSWSRSRSRSRSHNWSRSSRRCGSGSRRRARAGGSAGSLRQDRRGIARRRGTGRSAASAACGQCQGADEQGANGAESARGLECRGHEATPWAGQSGAGRCANANVIGCAGKPAEAATKNADMRRQCSLTAPLCSESNLRARVLTRPF
jgi:hypothetical protein